MRQFLVSQLDFIRCNLRGHDVRQEDEDDLFSNHEGYLRTACKRCKYPILLRIDPSDKEKNYYMLMEE